VRLCSAVNDIVSVVPLVYRRKVPPNSNLKWSVRLKGFESSESPQLHPAHAGGGLAVARGLIGVSAPIAHCVILPTASSASIESSFARSFDLSMASFKLSHTRCHLRSDLNRALKSDAR